MFVFHREWHFDLQVRIDITQTSEKSKYFSPLIDLVKWNSNRDNHNIFLLWLELSARLDLLPQ